MSLNKGGSVVAKEDQHEGSDPRVFRELRPDTTLLDQWLVKNRPSGHRYGRSGTLMCVYCRNAGQKVKPFKKYLLIHTSAIFLIPQRSATGVDNVRSPAVPKRFRGMPLLLENQQGPAPNQSPPLPCLLSQTLRVRHLFRKRAPYLWRVRQFHL